MSPVLAASLLFPSTSPPPAVEQPTRPDILLIVSDDQGWADLGCAGLLHDVETPNLDRLAASGVRFTQAYATSPICNASRAGLQTGCYQQRFGTFWYGGEGLHDARFRTLAEVLAGAGFVNGYVGKVHYGRGAAQQPGSRSFPLEHGFAHFFGFSGGRKHYRHHRAAIEDAFVQAMKEHEREGDGLQQGPMWDGAEVTDVEGFSTQLFGTRARQLLAAAHEGPRFVQVAFNAVHNFTHQLPPEYLEEQGLEGGHDWDPAKEDYADWYRAGRAPHNAEGRALYLGQLHFLDLEVGRLLDELERRGRRERTIVVYVGDNGGSTPIYASNGPLRGSKYTLYEGGIRVPLIVSWPGTLPEGEVRDAMVSVMDLFPTLCALAGADAPGHLDGADLGPLLRGESSKSPHETLYWDTGRETAVRHGKWKLRTARRRRHAERQMVELELGTFLYDLEADPGETRDLSADHPEQLQLLRDLHRRWRAELSPPR